MHNTLSCCFALILTLSCFSQRFIDKPPKKVSKIVSEFYSEKSINTSMQRTDSTIAYFIRDPKVQDLTIQFHFDPDGKCDKERYLLSCDSCYTKFLNGVLSNTRYHWMKVNEHTYFSKLPYRLILSLEPKSSFAYTIERSPLSRRDYKAILNSVNK